MRQFYRKYFLKNDSFSKKYYRRKKQNDNLGCFECDNAIHGQPSKSLFDSRFRYQSFIRNTSLSCNTSLLLENLWLGILILFMDVDKVIPFPTMLLNGIMIVMLMCQYSSLSFFLEPLIVEGEMVLAHLVVFESFSINDTFFQRVSTYGIHS